MSHLEVTAGVDFEAWSRPDLYIDTWCFQVRV